MKEFIAALIIATVSHGAVPPDISAMTNEELVRQICKIDTIETDKCQQHVDDSLAFCLCMKDDIENGWDYPTK